MSDSVFPLSLSIDATIRYFAKKVSARNRGERQPLTEGQLT